MKNHKNLGQTLSEQKMKEIKGGHTFSSAEFGVRCPLCGEIAKRNTYTYYITCENCGSIISIEKDTHAPI